MKAKTQRLWILVVGMISVACSIGLMMYAFSENITFFYAPADLAQQEISPQQRIRLGGMVSHIQQHGTEVNFTVTDYKHSIQVTYHGIPPDLFREGQGIVAEGYLVDNHFKAITLLAKHDENYMPPELKDIQP